MSQDFTSAMELALQQPTTYLCRIWELMLANGEVFRFTDANRDIVSDGETYVYDPGIKVSAIAAAVAGRDNNAEITVRTSSTFVSLGRVRQGALDGAEFSLWIIDWRDPDTYGRIDRFGGVVTTVSFVDKGLIKISLSGDIRAGGNSKIGEVYSRTCRAQLGDARCKVNLAALAVAFTVDNVTDGGFTIAASELVGIGDEYFKFGRITWLTGANATLGDEVKTSLSTGTATLTYTPRNTISVGDTGTITPGCNKDVVTCGVKFNNLNNHRGEPYVIDKLYQPIPGNYGNFPYPNPGPYGG
jgi:uncharacterized phage protein (TIGR02218 family)